MTRKDAIETLDEAIEHVTIRVVDAFVMHRLDIMLNDISERCHYDGQCLGDAVDGVVDGFLQAEYCKCSGVQGYFVDEIARTVERVDCMKIIAEYGFQNTLQSVRKHYDSEAEVEVDEYGAVCAILTDSKPSYDNIRERVIRRLTTDPNYLARFGSPRTWMRLIGRGWGWMQGCQERFRWRWVQGCEEQFRRKSRRRKRP